MRKRVVIALGLFAVFIAFGYFWTSEPRYHGRRLQVWIQVAASEHMKPSDELRARAAIIACGTNAIPFYLKLFQAKQIPGFGEKLLEFLQKHDLPTLGLEKRDEPLSPPIIASYGLSVLGPRAAAAAPALTGLVLTGDEFQRDFAGHALSYLGVAGAMALTNLLLNPDPMIRRFATSSMWNCGSPQGFLAETRRPEELRATKAVVVPALVGNLSDPDDRLKITSMQILGAFSGTEELVVPILSEKIRDPKCNPSVKIMAVQVLAKYGPSSKEATSGVLAALNDRDQRVIRGAGLALRQRSESYTPVVVRRFIEYLQDDGIPATNRADIVYELGRLGKKATNAVPAVLELIHANDAKIAAAARYALVEIDIESAAANGVDFSYVMRDFRNNRVRKLEAIHAMEKFESRANGNVPALREGLKSRDLEVRRAAGIALKKIAPEEAAKAGVE